MLGANLAYLERQLPQIHAILCRTLPDAVAGAGAVIVTQKRPEFVSALQTLGDRIAILDLVRVSEEARPATLTNYQGLSWAPTAAAVPAGSF